MSTSSLRWSQGHPGGPWKGREGCARDGRACVEGHQGNAWMMVSTGNRSRLPGASHFPSAFHSAALNSRGIPVALLGVCGMPISPRSTGTRRSRGLPDAMRQATGRAGTMVPGPASLG